MCRFFGYNQGWVYVMALALWWGEKSLQLRAHPGSLDVSFAPVKALAAPMVTQADGKVLACPGQNLHRFHPDGSRDTTFSVAIGGAPQALAVDSQGRILLGGEFTSVQGLPVTNIVRLLPDSTVDPSFTPPAFTGTVRKLLAQPDGAVLVSGGFAASWNETQPVFLFRLLADGSLDASFQTPVLMDGSGIGLYANTALQANGKIIVAGCFYVDNGVIPKTVFRLNPEGSWDESFNAPAFTNHFFSSVAVTTNEDIVLCGFLRNHAADSAPVVRLKSDGREDASFHCALAGSLWPWGPVCIAVQPDSRILVGSAREVGRSVIEPRDVVARLLGDGSLDPSFQADWTADIGPGAVRSLGVADNGQIFLGVYFPHAKDLGLQGVARLNGDAAPVITTPPASQRVKPGTAVALVAVAAGPGPMRYAWSKDGVVLAGATNNTLTLNPATLADTGIYQVVVANEMGAVRSPAAKLEVADTTFPVPGTLDSQFALTLPLSMGGMNLNSWAMLPDGRLALAGSINPDDYSELLRPQPYCWQADASGTFLQGYYNSYSGLSSVAALADGRVYLINYWQPTDSGILQRFQADGTRDEQFSTGPGTGHGMAAGPIVALLAADKGKVIVAYQHVEWFTTKMTLSLTRLKADGSVDDGFSTQMISEDTAGQAIIANRLASYPDGRFVLSGWFSKVGEVARTNLVRFISNGMVDESFNAGSAANGTIYSLVVDAEGRLLLAGEFTEVQGVPRNRIARLLPNGQLDASFDPGSGADATVYCLALQSNGRIWIGGAFATFNGAASPSIARLNADGSRDLACNFGTGFAGGAARIDALSLQPDGSLLAGGYFASYNGVPCSNLVRLFGDPRPAPLLSAPQWKPGQFQLQFTGESNVTYTLQKSANLRDWQEVREITITGAVETLPQSIGAEDRAGFYRAVPKAKD